MYEYQVEYTELDSGQNSNKMNLDTPALMRSGRAADRSEIKEALRLLLFRQARTESEREGLPLQAWCR